jgi:hypothetical protein
MTVTFPNVAAGQYTLTMKLAEVYYTAVGQRVFNVTVNGNPWLTSFDIIKTTGGLGKATDQYINVTLSTAGNITLNFTNIQGGACYEGISLLPASQAVKYGITFTWDDKTALTTGGAQYTFIAQQSMDSTGSNWNQITSTNLDANGAATGSISWNNSYPLTFKFLLLNVATNKYLCDSNNVCGLTVMLSPANLQTIVNQGGINGTVRFAKSNNAIADFIYGN